MTWRWPWVEDRRVADPLIAEKDARIADLMGQLALAQEGRREITERYAALVEKITTPVPAPVVPEPSVPAPRERSIIDAAVRQEARGDTRLARYFRDRARTLKLEHPDWDDGRIAKELTAWEHADAMPAAFLHVEA